MNVSLTDDLSAFVAEQLKEGGYNNQSEVIREGLRLLRIRYQKVRRLRQEVELGVLDADTGRTKPLSDDLLRDIADRGRRRSGAKRRRPT